MKLLVFITYLTRVHLEYLNPTTEKVFLEKKSSLHPISL